MTSPIDSSRPYRWPSELVALVEAVTRTDPNNESTWIEWKSTLDLEAKTGEHHIARQVLGFANRTVATASHHADGLAYLIVGAEPGNVGGVKPLDPAVLRPRIERYVGSAVRWRAEYISVQGQQVLVVIVEPPQNGDPIYPARQQIDKHTKGSVLVRRQGSIDSANDFEIDQLVARARAGKGLGIVVEAVSAVIERCPPLPDPDEVAEAELAATLARPRADRTAPGLLGSSAFGGQLSSILGGTPDDRTQEDYEAEAQEYIEDYKDAVFSRAIWRLWRHKPTCLVLEVRNVTDDNFTDIEIEVHVPGEVRTWPEDLEDIAEGAEPVLPNRPDVLGTWKHYMPAAFGSAFNIGNQAMLNSPVFHDPGPTFTARDSGSVTINFSDINLRPHARELLPQVRLLVHAAEGEVLNCTWKATASNVSGQLKGDFSLTVRASTLDYDAETD